MRPFATRSNRFNLRSCRGCATINCFSRILWGGRLLPFRIFVSSPGDVGAERGVAIAVAERLQFQFRGQIHLEMYTWERSLLRATSTFQDQILDIQEADLAIFILWARMGTPLPLDRFSRCDGSQYSSGTEYEFERAREGYDKNKKPEILCYQKIADVQLPTGDRTRLAEKVAGLDAINRFVDKWFRNPDNTFKAAFYNFQKTAQFEDLLEIHLEKWLRERLKSTEMGDSAVSQWQGSPFRGLKSFDFEHALIYCGRTALVADLLEALRRRASMGRAFIMVTGMSGVGKSSLVKAGLLPILMRPYVVERVLGWRRAVFNPNIGEETLLGGFAAALLEANALPELADEDADLESLLVDPAALTTALNNALQRATRTAHEKNPNPDTDPDSALRLILVCDQFETIFDQTVTEEERGAFCEAVRALVLTGRVWVVATLRADFFSRCGELPERFRDLFIDGGFFTAGGPRPAELSQMIRRPAAIAGLRFERRGDPEEGLDDVLRDAAAGNPTVLPLLEFTLDELWKRSKGSGILRFSDYEALGSLHGALKLRADEEFGRLAPAVQASLPKVLASLIHTDPTDDRLIIQNRASRAQFSEGPENTLVNAFVSAHLLVGDRAADSTPVIGLAHEALLREWPPAVEWIEGNREMLRLRGGIAAAAAVWRNSGRDPSRLLSGPALKDAKRLLSREIALTNDDRSFVDLSITEDGRRRWRAVKIGALAAAIMILAVVGSATGMARISYGVSFAHVLPLVWSNESNIPVSDAARANLDRSVSSLASFLSVRASERASRPDLNPWARAQIWVALYGLDPALAGTGQELRGFMTANRAPECLCWKEAPDRLPHAMVTAWVLFALAHYDQPATADEIGALLSRQSPAGWWPMFPAGPEDKNASTSATAFTALALHRQLDRKLIAAEQEPKAREAVKKAADWLERRANPGEGRWSEYPPEQTFDRGDGFPAVSALAIHVMRTARGTRQFDSPWLASLPIAVPEPLQNETAKAHLFRGNNEFTQDDARHYRYPWMLRATVDAYAAGSIWQRAAALLWIEDALRRPLTPGELSFEAWTSAEILFALRHAQDVLKRK